MGGNALILGWTWQQALAFLIVWALVCGPWLYMAWSI